MGEAETLTCHTTNRDGYWEYKIDLKICADCSTRHLCTHSKDCAKTVQRSVPGIQPGEDYICCHESEKSGHLAMDGEACSVRPDPASAYICQKPSLRTKGRPGFLTG